VALQHSAHSLATSPAKVFDAKSNGSHINKHELTLLIVSGVHDVEVDVDVDVLVVHSGCGIEQSMGTGAGTAFNRSSVHPPCV